jgi:hypothetical protein
MVTVVPAGPATGENAEMVGRGITVKLAPLLPVCPPIVTLIGPVVALLGIVMTSWVGLAEITVAVAPLNLTVLLDAVALKLVPLMVTCKPECPLGGTKLVIVGGVVTVYLALLMPVRPLTVTLIVPVVAPLGIVIVS